MKKVMILLIILLIGLAGISNAQSAKDALKSLKRLEAYCQTGISPIDFSRALGDAKFEVNLFLESKEATQNVPLVETIKTIIAEYEDVQAVFRDASLGPYRNLDYIAPFSPAYASPALLKDLEERRKKEEAMQEYYKGFLVKYPDSNKQIEEGGSLTVDRSDIGKAIPKYGRKMNLNYLYPIILKYASRNIQEAMKLLPKEE